MRKILRNSCSILLIALAIQVNAQGTSYSWSNLPSVAEPVFKEDTLNIVDFGAEGDGISMNTVAINKAILECSSKGGGVVLVPKGYWLTGPIKLRNNVNLHLAKNAFLQFSKNMDDYKIIESNFEGRKSARNESPIMGVNLENIAITGEGVIDGNGDAWRMVKRGKLTENEWKTKVESGGVLSDDEKIWFPTQKSKNGQEWKDTTTISTGADLQRFEAIKDFLRPNLVSLFNCKKVLLEGVTFQNSPAWNIHPLMCENLTLRNLFVKNPDYAQNGDGVDIESCKNVLVEHCVFDVGDDAICIKSGKDEEGRKRGRPTENVIIRNNTVYKAHGGFVVGSEMSGGAKNIFVSDCTFMGTGIGIRFKTTRGRGGVVENIFIRNINMSNIINDAVYFDMYYFVKSPAANEKVTIPPVTEATPIFRDVFIENIICNGAKKGVFIRGIPEMPISNIQLKNLTLNTNEGIEIKDAKGIVVENVKVTTLNRAQALVYIETSQDLTFDNLSSDSSNNVVFDVNGDTSAGIKIKNSKSSVDASNVIFNHGAKSSSLKFY